MPSRKTPEEVRREHTRALGPGLGPVYHALWNECAWLHLKWAQYRELYGKGSERIEILNRSAGLFFRIVQDGLWEDVLLHLARLTDPSMSPGRRTNLSLTQLPDLIDEPTRRASVDAAVQHALAATAFARDWRNRHIAHRDLALAMNQGSQPLAPASRAKVTEAVNAVAAVVAKVGELYLNADVRFDLTPYAGDAEAMLYVLRDGLDADNRRRRRFSQGKTEPEDFEGPTPL